MRILTGVSRLVNPLTALSLFLLLTALVHGQTSISGKWKGTTRNGMQVVLDLKVADGAFTGTLNRDGQSSKITEAKVSKSSFTFNAVLGDQREALTGEVDGEHLKIWLDRQGREATVVFSRIQE